MFYDYLKIVELSGANVELQNGCRPISSKYTQLILYQCCTVGTEDQKCCTVELQKTTFRDEVLILVLVTLRN